MKTTTIVTTIKLAKKFHCVLHRKNSLHNTHQYHTLQKDEEKKKESNNKFGQNKKFKANKKGLQTFIKFAKLSMAAAHESLNTNK